MIQKICLIFGGVMFAFIKGSIEEKASGYVVIETGGVGYKIYMPEPSIETLGEIGEIVKVHTYYWVREDNISLYGFSTREELRMFEILIGTSGIGAKSAVSILSNIDPSSFALAIINEDTRRITKLPGIGAKTAARMILELKDKLKKQELEAKENSQKEELQKAVIEDENINEAISALQVLGYTKREIEKAFDKTDLSGMSVEDMIRKGLALLSK